MASNQSPSYNRRRGQKAAMAALGISEKRPTAGHNVSHAQNKTKRLFKPNLQKATLVVDGKKVSLRVDTRTLRTLTKAIKERTPVKPKRATKKAAPAAKKPAAK